MQLLPIDDAPPRVEYEPSYRAAPSRHIHEGYIHTPPYVDAGASRIAPPPPPPRRVSDQETVLPSVERETVDLVSPPRAVQNQRPMPDRNSMSREYNDMHSSKRKAYPLVSQPTDRSNEAFAKRRKASAHEQHVHQGLDLSQSATYPPVREYLPLETRSRHRAHPSQEIVDLTSSPQRPPFGRAGDLLTAPQGYPVPGPHSYAYAPEMPRRSPVRIDHHEQPVGARPTAYRSEQDRMYQRRAPPAHEYVPLRR